MRAGSKPDYPGHAGEVDILGQQEGSMAPRNGRDHAIQQTTWRDAGVTAPSVDAYRGVKVGDRAEMQQFTAQQ